jgi:hypothetical protein
MFDRSEGTMGELPMDLLTDIIRVALMKTTYEVNIDSHDQFDDVEASEIVCTGYAARGDAVELTTKTITRQDDFDRVTFDADNHTFTSIGGAVNDTFDQVVIMREQDASATNANTELLAHLLTPEQTTTGGTVTLIWNAVGVLQGV